MLTGQKERKIMCIPSEFSDSMNTKKYLTSATYHPTDDAEAANNSELIVSRLIEVLVDERLTYGQALFHLDLAMSKINRLLKSGLVEA